MASTMKAAVVRELGKPLAIEEVPVPQPNESQILVRIAATGIQRQAGFCFNSKASARGYA